MNMITSQSLTAVKPKRCGRQAIGVWDLICWAFQRECASLDFVEQDTWQSQAPQSRDTIAKMIDINQLGCRVQGGGRSEPHHDAQIVAGTLAVLPEACGGRRAALWVAECARAGRLPAYDAPRSIVAAQGYTQNRHGRRGVVADASELGEEGWPPTIVHGRKGARVVAVPYVPIEIRPSASEVAYMRRAYLQFYGALLDVRSALSYSHLTSFTVTDAMPPRTPWKKTS